MPDLERPAEVFPRRFTRNACRHRAPNQVIAQVRGSLEPALTAGAENRSRQQARLTRALRWNGGRIWLRIRRAPHLPETRADPMPALITVDLGELPQ